VLFEADGRLHNEKLIGNLAVNVNWQEMRTEPGWNAVKGVTVSI
jgi:hypothetical protein